MPTVSEPLKEILEGVRKLAAETTKILGGDVPDLQGDILWEMIRHGKVISTPPAPPAHTHTQPPLSHIDAGRPTDLKAYAVPARSRHGSIELV